MNQWTDMITYYRQLRNDALSIQMLFAHKENINQLIINFITIMNYLQRTDYMFGFAIQIIPNK